MMKIVLVVLIVIALFAAWRVHSKFVQARRERAYRETLAPFQRDLGTGMTRADVQSYPDSRRVSYSAVLFRGENAWSYETKIGEEPGDGLFCESWIVYAAFEFNSSGNEIPEPKPLSADTLKNI